MGGDLEMQKIVNANANIPLGVAPDLPNNNKMNETMENAKLLNNSTMSVAPVAGKPVASKKQVVAKKSAFTKGKKAAPESDSGSEEDSSEEEGKASNKK